MLPTETTTYCLPACMNVIGVLFCPTPRSISESVAPVALSSARNFVPPTFAGERGVLLSACVTNSSVFVAMTADGVASPSGGRLRR